MPEREPTDQELRQALIDQSVSSKMLELIQEKSPLTEHYEQKLEKANEVLKDHDGEI